MPTRLAARSIVVVSATHTSLTRFAPAHQRALALADFLTENESGYPLLFQSGETAHGVPLHDHQHPHDWFSELAVDYSERRLWARRHSCIAASRPTCPTRPSVITGGTLRTFSSAL